MSILTTSCFAVKSMESFAFFEGAGMAHAIFRSLVTAL
jgi:hypothetical protein